MDLKRLGPALNAVLRQQVNKVQGAGDLTNAENAAVLIESIQAALEEIGDTLEDELSQELLQEYFQSVERSSKELKTLGFDINDVDVFTDTGRIRAPFQSRIHLEALEELTDDTMLDLNAAIRTASDNVGISIDTALDNVRQSITEGNLLGDDRRTIQQRVGRSLADNGFTSFVTRDGKKLPLDFYANTVANTKVRDAAVKGSVNRYLENDVNLVEILGNGDSCAYCSAHRGVVVRIGGNDPRFRSDIPLPPYHPNCRCGVSPVVASFLSEDEMQAYQDRSNAYDPEEDRRTAAQKNAYAEEQERNRARNAEKKQYASWKSVLGDDAPATLGAFRRMKHENTENFQWMQSEYRSASQKIANIARSG